MLSARGGVVAVGAGPFPVALQDGVAGSQHAPRPLPVPLLHDHQQTAWRDGAPQCLRCRGRDAAAPPLSPLFFSLRASSSPPSLLFSWLFLGSARPRRSSSGHLEVLEHHVAVTRSNRPGRRRRGCDCDSRRPRCCCGCFRRESSPFYDALLVTLQRRFDDGPSGPRLATTRRSGARPRLVQSPQPAQPVAPPRPPRPPRPRLRLPRHPSPLPPPRRRHGCTSSASACAAAGAPRDSPPAAPPPPCSPAAGAVSSRLRTCSGSISPVPSSASAAKCAAVNQSPKKARAASSSIGSSGMSPSPSPPPPPPRPPPLLPPRRAGEDEGWWWWWWRWWRPSQR